MKAAEIMTTNVVTISELATIFQATKLMKEHDVKTLIVDRASKDDAYGIITTTDISRAIAEGKDPAITYVCEIMTKPCIVVNPNLPVKDIPRLFAKAKITIAPVIQDKLLGIISITDILNKKKYSKENQVKLRLSSLTKSPESTVDSSIEKEWEIVDWEKEFDNWCSG